MVTKTLGGYSVYCLIFVYIQSIMVENRKALPNEASNLVGLLLKLIIITRQKGSSFRQVVVVVVKSPSSLYSRVQFKTTLALIA